MNTLQVPELGWLGGFGNRIHIYCVARKYAERNDAVLFTPPWMGEAVFDFDVPIQRPPSPLPDWGLEWPLPGGFTGDTVLRDFAAFNYPAIYSRSDLRRYLKIKPRHFAGIFQTEIAVPFRKFCSDDGLPDMQRPQVSLAGLRQGVMAAGLAWNKIDLIAQYQPEKTTPEDRNADLSFIEDFVRLATAHHVFAYPYSTFSGYAAWLNRNHVHLPHGYAPGSEACSWKPAQSDADFYLPNSWK